MADGDQNNVSHRTRADKLRKVFYQKYKDNKQYDQRDVDNVSSNDLYVSQFIRQTETIEEAADRLHQALKWRKEVGIRDVTDSTFLRSDWEIGGIYFHNTDKDGRYILWFKIKEHKKIPEKLPELKLFISYFFEMAYNDRPEDEIVILFDMTDTRLANLDFDIVRYILTSFKIHYPTLLGYMVVYEMPWIFTAAWKVIKSWLSAEARAKLKFLNKSEIQEYVDRENLPEHMGGTDTWVYKYIPPEEREGEEKEIPNPTTKRVTFADQEESTENVEANNSAMSSPRANASPSPKSNLNRNASYNRNQAEGNTFIGRLLMITPAEELEFMTEDGSMDAYNTISLKNTLPYSIAFKVKTTSPEKYKVRPSSGIVKPGSTSEVYIYLQGNTQSIEKDKFLIMAMELTGDAPENLAEYWKTVPKENIMEHRLKCVQISRSESNQSSLSVSMLTPEDKLTTLTAKVDALVESNNSLQTTVRRAIWLQIITLLLFLLFVIYSYYNSAFPIVDPVTEKLSDSPAANYCSGGLF